MNYKRILRFSVRITGILVIITIITIYSIGGGFGERVSNNRLHEGNPLIFAHKGMLNYYAENSLEGFLNSEAVGFTALEADVNITRDKKLINFHDRNCRTLLGIDSKTKEVTFKEIQEKFILHNKKLTSNKVMLLSELIDRFKGRVILYLDFKESDISIANSVLEELEKCNAYDSILIADQSLVFLSYLKFKEPRIKTVLEGFYAHKQWFYYIIPKNFKPDYYASFMHEVSEDHVEFLEANNLLKRKIVYGVDTTNLKDVHRFGIQNIIIDYDSTLSIKNIGNLLRSN